MTSGRNVAILGGGMAGLAAAWRLTDPSNAAAGVPNDVGMVTVYQRGHRLGGKAASHRGLNGRIEEHGLHVWLGYYDNAFRLIRQCYEQLDRADCDPACPIQSWEDVFQAAPTIGLEDFHNGDWKTWTAVFPPNDRKPGEPLGESTSVLAADILRQSVKLAATFLQSLDGPKLELGTSMALAGVAEVEKAAGALQPILPAFGGIQIMAEMVRDRLKPVVVDNDSSRRLWQLFDLIVAQVKGMVKDDLLTKGFRSIDHIEYRDWIASHGASRETLEGALVRGLYDLAFSHRGGDPGRTEFPAGLGLFLATKTFFDYRGALFWKMQAGMGDVVVAPIYEVLRKRGVRFEFFHRVDDLVPDEAGELIDRVELGRQVKLRDDLSDYDPLIRHDELPCFPAEPDEGQLDAGSAVAGAELESFWSTWPDADKVELVRGRDFDDLVFAIPVGMARHVTGQLAQGSPPWQRMLESVETVGTQAFQLWLKPSEEELGWSAEGSTVTSYVDTYDTWSSMSHLIEAEGWPAEQRPGSVAYFCSSMRQEDVDDPTDLGQPGRASNEARQAAVQYLENSVGHYWPNAIDEDGRFRWDLLVGAAPDAGPEAIDTQYVTANVDPSDRYVQALPGTDQARLRADESGFANMRLAGDWTDCGLNAGCIEAAVISGLAAANSILGLPLDAGVSGGYRT